MNTKARLKSIHGLLSDIYGQTLHVGVLLTGYLDETQLERIKCEKLDAFLDCLLFGIRCRFASMGDGMRLYWGLANRYNLEGKLLTLRTIDDWESISREGVRQWERKALRQLRPRHGRDITRQIACLAAREVLGLQALPPHLSPPWEDAPTLLSKGELESFPIVDEGISLKTLHANINAATGAKQGEKGHIALSRLRSWLLGEGLLEMVPQENGTRSARPTEAGIRAGLYTAEYESERGSRIVTLYSPQAQEMIRDALPMLALPSERPIMPNQGASWTPELEELLKKRFAEGASVAELAEEMGRSRGGISARLKKLDLAGEEEAQSSSSSAQRQ